MIKRSLGRRWRDSYYTNWCKCFSYMFLFINNIGGENPNHSWRALKSENKNDMKKLWRMKCPPPKTNSSPPWKLTSPREGRSLTTTNFAGCERLVSWRVFFSYGCLTSLDLWSGANTTQLIFPVLIHEDKWPKSVPRSTIHHQLLVHTPHLKSTLVNHRLKTGLVGDMLVLWGVHLPIVETNPCLSMNGANTKHDAWEILVEISLTIILVKHPKKPRDFWKFQHINSWPTKKNIPFQFSMVGLCKPFCSGYWQGHAKNRHTKQKPLDTFPEISAFLTWNANSHHTTPAK